jgi:hypothetical protein
MLMEYFGGSANTAFEIQNLLKHLKSKMYDLEIIIKLISPGSIPTTGSGFGSGC